MHSVANYQLLDIGTNRNKKRAKPLKDWISGYVADHTSYLNRHLIPTDKFLWLEENFEQFVMKRTEMIVAKVTDFVPVALPDSFSDEPQSQPPVSNEPVNLPALLKLFARSTRSFYFE
ncbi:MAG: hypothetical protein R3E31_27245 [Chloroflexota bacterium]